MIDVPVPGVNPGAPYSNIHAVSLGPFTHVISTEKAVRLSDLNPYPIGHVGGMYSSAPMSYPVDGNNGLASPSISVITPKLAPLSAANAPCKCKSDCEKNPGNPK